jgi:hypothetical protein
MKLLLYIIGVLLLTVLAGPELAGQVVGISIVAYLFYKLAGLLTPTKA